MSILRWILGRIGAAALVAWVVTTVVFFALRIAGGDPTEAILGGPGSQAGEEAVAQARADYGLDKPLVVQYLVQMQRIVTLQLGDSYARKTPVAELVGAQLGSTMLLAVCALVLAWVIALTLATVATRAHGLAGRAVAATIQAGEVVATVVPHFWLGAVLILVFSSSLGWFPATSVGAAPAGLVLPVVTLAIPTAGFLGQVMRDGLAEAAASPFATTARARGASESRILWRHSLRHAALPAISLSGWSFGSLLSGAVVVESLFGRPGMGRLLLDATNARDVPVVVAVVLVVAVAYTVVMTVADGVERLVDPRPRGAARATDRPEHRPTDSGTGSSARSSTDAPAEQSPRTEKAIV